MTLQAKKPDDISTLDFLVYGSPGAGKTHLAGTAADYEPTSDVLVADIDGGVTTLRGKDVEVVDINTTEQMKELYEWVKLHLQKRGTDEIGEINDHIGVDEDVEFNTVVLDTLTELQAYAMNEATNQEEGIVDVNNIASPTFNEWGDNYSFLRSVVKGFSDLDINTIMTAHVKEEKDDKTGKETKTIDLAGQLTVEVPGIVDFVGYLYTDVSEEGDTLRKLLTEQQNGVVAKDRSNNLDTVVEEPTIQKMMDQINDDE
jgi:hypothetical protein